MSRNVYIFSLLLHYNPRSAQKYDLFSTILLISFGNLAIHVAVPRDSSVSPGNARPQYFLVCFTSPALKLATTREWLSPLLYRFLIFQRRSTTCLVRFRDNLLGINADPRSKMTYTVLRFHCNSSWKNYLCHLEVDKFIEVLLIYYVSYLFIFFFFLRI